MARKFRKTAILAKIETTPYTDAAPTGAANAIQIANLDVTPYNAQNVDRNLVRAAFGRSGQLVGPGYVELSFEVELAGSGAAGTAPAYGPLLRACAFAEAITASTGVDYTPVTDSLETVTIYYHRDGVKHAAVGCQGTFELLMNVGQRPALKFTFKGKSSSVPTATADPTLTLTAWKVPEVVSDANTADLLIGCAYSAGALTGGTAYTSGGLSFNLGGTVSFTPLVGAEYIDFTDRQPVGSLMLDLTAAQEVTFDGYVRANTLQSIGMIHGTATGKKVIVFGGQVQLMNRKHQDVNGVLMNAFDLGFDPSSGNDEFRICVL